MRPLRTAAGTVRAVVVDDTPDLRLLLRLTLERDGDIDVVGEAANGRAGIDVVSDLQPELVMLDLAMPVMDGLEALPRIREACPDTCVIVLSGFEAGAMRARSLDAGAQAYLQKGASPSEILDLVRTVVARHHAHVVPEDPVGADETVDGARPGVPPARAGAPSAPAVLPSQPASDGRPDSV